MCHTHTTHGCSWFFVFDEYIPLLLSLSLVSPLTIYYSSLSLSPCSSFFRWPCPFFIYIFLYIFLCPVDSALHGIHWLSYFYCFCFYLLVSLRMHHCHREAHPGKKLRKCLEDSLMKSRRLFIYYTNRISDCAQHSNLEDNCVHFSWCTFRSFTCLMNDRERDDFTSISKWRCFCEGKKRSNRAWNCKQLSALSRMYVIFLTVLRKGHWVSGERIHKSIDDRAVVKTWAFDVRHWIDVHSVSFLSLCLSHWLVAMF